MATPITGGLPVQPEPEIVDDLADEEAEEALIHDSDDEAYS